MDSLRFFMLTLFIIFLRSQKEFVLAGRGKREVRFTERQNPWIAALMKFEKNDPCKQYSIWDGSAYETKQQADIHCITAKNAYADLPDRYKRNRCKNPRQAACYRKTQYKYRCGFIVDAPSVGGWIGCATRSSQEGVFIRLKTCIKYLDLNPPTWDDPRLN
nr:PREDICTED: uncharacterized protein LOC109037659 [Bemisia tabaci]